MNIPLMTDEKLNWLEQIPNKLEKLEENAQAACK